jgi:hypothetical protein
MGRRIDVRPNSKNCSRCRGLSGSQPLQRLSAPVIRVEFRLVRLRPEPRNVVADFMRDHLNGGPPSVSNTI